MTGQFSNNAARHRYEYAVGAETAFANYRVENGVLYIDYVEAPVALRGTGAAGALMQQVMDKARQDGRKVVPICGYAASWIRRHPEYDDLKG
jgi:predicted GNAT family acetyltransferase